MLRKTVCALSMDLVCIVKFHVPMSICSGNEKFISIIKKVKNCKLIKKRIKWMLRLLKSMIRMYL